MLRINRKAIIYTIPFWLVSLLLLNFISFQINQQTLNSKISSFLSPYFLVTLDESIFSNDEVIVNDRNSITNIGKTINGAISNFVKPSRISAIKACTAAVYTIDNVRIDTEFQAKQYISLLIPRNKITREIEVGFSCEHKASFYIVSSTVLSFILLLLFLLLPYPLSSMQLDWKKYLIAKGYSDTDAFQLSGNSSINRLSFNESQLLCYENIHSQKKRNHPQTLKIASDKRIANLDLKQLEWFLWSLEKQQNDIEHALKIAQSSDVIEVDLLAGSLTIHGVEIQVKKTPLFYYAWYATKRINGDGWLVNPRSNKPDYEAVTELTTLMHQFSGHAKAIDDLENAGLKARTLDQNRSKIKDEIIAVLGKTLAEAYLFQSKKDPVTLQTSYRLSISEENIRIIT